MLLLAPKPTLLMSGDVHLAELSEARCHVPIREETEAGVSQERDFALGRIIEVRLSLSPSLCLSLVQIASSFRRFLFDARSITSTTRHSSGDKTEIFYFHQSKIGFPSMLV